MTAVTKIEDVRRVLAHVQLPAPSPSAGAQSSVHIDWSKVDEANSWLKSSADLPSTASSKLRTIVDHDGSLTDLSTELISQNLLVKPYQSWSDVTLAATSLLRQCSLSPEKIAEALSGDLPFNNHMRRQKDRRRAIERAINHAGKLAQAAIGRPKFRDFNKSGQPQPTLANAKIAIAALGITPRFDSFHNRTNIEYRGNIRTISDGALTDNLVMAIRDLIDQTYGFDCGDPITLTAIKAIAFENVYDPVLDYLDSCQVSWDGTKRIENWVIDYLGCVDTPLNRAIARLSLVAAVRRARSPGCKFDNIIVLEGPEGKDKSTAINVLAGDDNFSDQSVLGLSEKEVQEQLEGVWLHESADLAGLKKAEIERVKAFASRRYDRARRAYGRVREDVPRRCINFGTTNDDEYLQSQTGNRRFWPLRTSKLHIKALARDRDQLWGEAAASEAAGESIVLDPSLWDDARQAQEERRIKDPWEDLLSNLQPTSGNVSGAGVVHRLGNGCEFVSSSDLLSTILLIPGADQNSGHTRRLAHVMKQLGWEKPTGGRCTINGEQMRGYIRAIMPSPTAASNNTAPPSAEPTESVVVSFDEAKRRLDGAPPEAHPEHGKADLGGSLSDG